MIGRKGYVVAVGLFVATTGSAPAQIDNGLPGPQPLDAGALALNRQLLSGVMDHNQEVRDGKGTSPAGVLAYRRDPAVTERVKRSYLARAEKAYGLKVAAGLRQLLATNDFVALWTKGAASDGMRPNDLGDSVAEYWATNWAIAKGLSNTTPAQTRALRYQIGPTIARNPAVRRMSAAQKQEFSEGLMLNLVVEVVGAAAAQKSGDPATIQKVRTQTAARFKSDFGVDLNALSLTRRGLARA